MTKLLINPYMRIMIALGTLAAMVIMLGNTGGIKERIGHLVFEKYIKIKPRPASDRLVFVDIDDQSLSTIGQWPWPRKIMADMITNIKASGAEVIIFDGVLAEPDRTSPSNIAELLPDDHPSKKALLKLPGNDAILADAIRKTGVFVAGFSHGSNLNPPVVKSGIRAKRDVRNFILSQKGRGSLYFQKTAQFLPELQSAAAGNGSFMASAENDSVIRRTGLIFHNGKTLYPSLMIEGLRLYKKDSNRSVTVKRNEAYETSIISEPLIIESGAKKIPMSADGKMWVYFRHFAKSEDISADKFIGETYRNENKSLAGKIVFIASSAEGLMDLRATPLGMQAGVRVHMNAMEQILQDNYLIRPALAPHYEMAAAIAVSVILITLSFLLNPAILAVITAGLSASMFALSWYLFNHFGGLIDPVTPTFIVVMIFFIVSALSFLKTELEKRQVRDAFGLYISPEFMKELTADPDKLKLGGEIRDLTIMFTDIRNFTSISEGLAPEELIQLMNDFLTPMSDLVMQNRGTIDKYMGDAMMAFWNAPLDDADHARNACLTAIGMQAALDPINQAVEKRAQKMGREPILLKAGIGINTGQSAVGNMGSKQRFAYSTLGDPVNLASRLEGQTKNYGADILIGESTWNAVQDFAALEMDLVQVQGKSIPVRIFGLFGLDDMAGSGAFQAQKAKHDGLIKLYRVGDFKAALKALKACRETDSLSLSKAYDLYEERCKTLIENPPAQPWDGVYVATSK